MFIGKLVPVQKVSLKSAFDKEYRKALIFIRQMEEAKKYRPLTKRETNELMKKVHYIALYLKEEF